MGDETTATPRQRRKRKWDQPAEGVASAAVSIPMPGLISFPGAGPLAALGMPGMFGSLMGVFPSMAVPMPSFPYSAPSAVPNSAAAAIVQKINQDLATKGLIPHVKIHDEVIAREIIINDAEPGVRYKLTKRQTQEEIQAKTGAVVITRGRYRGPNGPVDCEKPLYLHISAGVHLKDTAERIKSVDAAAALVEEMMKQGGVSGPPSSGTIPSGMGGPPFTVVVPAGFDTEPSFNLVGRIRGPNDQFINHIITETGAEVVVRGRGSGNHESSCGEELPQSLHLFISSDNLKSLDDARRLSENLLDTIRSDSLALRAPSYQPRADRPPLSFPPGSAGPHVLSAAQLPYQHPNFPYPVPPGMQNPWGTYASGYPMGPPVCPPVPAASMPMVSPQLGGFDKNLVNPYTNMLPPTKVYGAVPPPRQLAGEMTYGTNMASTIDSSIEVGRPAMESAAAPSPPQICGSVNQGPLQAGLRANYMLGAPPYSQVAGGATHHHNPALSGPAPSSYSGYSAVYPQAAPQQQFASVLQRPPPPVSIRPGSGPAVGAPPATKAQGIVSNHRQSEWHSEKQFSGPPQKERRKFQEFPVAGKLTARDEFQPQWAQGVGPFRLDGPSLSSEAGQSRMGQALPPPRSLPPPRKMPPLPPKYISKAASASSQPDKEGTGLKLVEYGEEDDEPEGRPELQPQQVPTPPFSNGKPFWAA